MGVQGADRASDSWLKCDLLGLLDIALRAQCHRNSYTKQGDHHAGRYKGTNPPAHAQVPV
jgi:hypothetical protein